MATRSSDIRQVLREKFPRVASRLPEGAIGPLGVVYTGWRKIGYGRYVIAALIMALIPIAQDNNVIPYLEGTSGQRVLVTTGIWILLTLGLSVVVGMAGLLDLGYVAFYMIGAYVMALMTQSGTQVGDTQQFHFVEWPTIAVLPFSILVAMAAGVALGTPTLRLRGDYLAIVTLGFHEIVRQSANNLSFTNGSRGIASLPHPVIFGFDFGSIDPTYYWYYLLVPMILLAVIMIRHLEDSRVGRYWTAIREDEVAAAAMGVPVVKMKVLAFAIGASTSGAAGWVYGSYINFINPQNFPLLDSILVLCAVVIGGLGSISGAVLGAVLVRALPEVIRNASGEETIFGFDPETGRIAIFGFLLILVMIFRPGGLLAARRRRIELSEASVADAVITSDKTTEDGIAERRLEETESSESSERKDA